MRFASIQAETPFLGSAENTTAHEEYSNQLERRAQKKDFIIKFILFYVSLEGLVAKVNVNEIHAFIAPWCACFYN
jgi:hypothetical protein